MISIRSVLILALALSAGNIYPQTVSAQNSSGLAGANPHAISLYNLGLSAYKQGSPESAIIFFKRAVDLDPDLADAQYNLGVLYQSERRLKEAVPRFQEALRVKPDDADSHYQLGLALIDLNQLSDARQHFSAIAPNSGHFTDAQKKLTFIASQMAGNQNPSSDNGLMNSANSQTTDMNTGIQNSPGLVSGAPAPSVQTSETNLPLAATQTGAVRSAALTSAPAANVTADSVAGAASESAQVIAGGFSAPSGLAFDRQGVLYIANFLTSTIDRIAADGGKNQFCNGTNLKGPIGLVFDKDNNLYVANYLAGTITKINPAGISQIIASGLKKPYYLALDKAGNLFVSQQEDNSVARINLSGGNTAIGVSTAPSGQ